MNQYYVIKRSAGYPVKAFTSEERKGKERKECSLLTAVRKIKIQIISYM